MEISQIKDKGYAWVVLISCFLAHILCDGVNLSFGVLIPVIKKNMNTSSATAALIGSLNIGTSYLFAPIISMLVEVIGYKKTMIGGGALTALALVTCGFCTRAIELMFLYGVVAGLGICMTVTPAKLIINEYFDERRVLAYGIYFSGSSIGCLASAPIVNYVVDNYGLPTVFHVEGFATACTLLFGLLLKDPTKASAEGDNSTHDQDTFTQKVKGFLATIINKTTFANKAFVLCMIGQILNFIPLMVPLLYIPSLALENDITETQGGYAITILGISNLLGRLLCGILDKFPNLIMAINLIGSISCSLILIIMPHCNDYKSLYAISCTFGFFSVPTIVLWPSILVILVGSDSFSSAYALTMLCYGTMTLAGPAIIGILIDHYQLYTYPFYLGAVCFGISSLFQGGGVLITSSTQGEYTAVK